MQVCTDFFENLNILSDYYSLFEIWSISVLCIINQRVPTQVTSMTSHCTDDNFGAAKVPKA